MTFQGYLPSSLGERYLHYQITGETPLSTKGSTDEADVGTVSGLTAGSSVEADLSWIDWPHATESLTDSMNRACGEMLSSAAPGTSVKEFLAANVDVNCSRSLADAGTLQSMVNALNAAIDKCNSESGAQLAADYGCQLLKGKPHAYLTATALSPDTAKSFRATMDGLERQSPSVTLITLGATVARQSDSYFNQDNPSTLTSAHTTGYGVNLEISRLLPYFLMYSAGFSYQKSYDNGDNVQICSPVSGSASLECVQGAMGPPKQTFSRIVFLESRYLLSSSLIAVAPRVEYDFTTSKFAAKLPIYFAPDKSQIFTGGVTLGYVAHGSGFGATIFVNKAFGFY